MVKGNPIGAKIMDSLKGPLEMAKAAQNGNEPPNMADMMALMAKVGGAVNDAKMNSGSAPKKSKNKKK